jgi:pyruvate-formate lyase
MALHDRDILRTMAFGIAGLSIVADSLAAIKYADVHVIRDETGLAVDYRIEGMKEGTNQAPQFGNNDDRVDSIAADLVTRFMGKVRKHPTYRNATHTRSVLTITSNVVYGKHTGNTPDGRRTGRPSKHWRLLARCWGSPVRGARYRRFRTEGADHRTDRAHRTDHVLVRNWHPLWAPIL